MNKKLFLIPVFLILLIGFVSAVPTDGISNYPFSEGTGTTLSDNWGSNDGTITSATWNSAVPTYSGGGSPHRSLDFDGTNDLVSADGLVPSLNSDKGAISLWFKSDDQTATHWLWSFNDYGTAGYFIGFTLTTDGYLQFNIGSGRDFKFESREDYVDNAWHHAVVQSSGSTNKIYVDGVDKTLTFVEGSNDGTWLDACGSTPDTFSFGVLSRAAPAGWYDGLITSASFYDDDLTSTEIGYLYECNDVEGCSAPSANPFGVTNTNSINNMTLYLENGTNYSTTTGTIATLILSNETPLLNFTLEGEANYFNITETDYNTSTNYSATFTEFPRVTIYDVWDNTTLTNFTIRYNVSEGCYQEYNTSTSCGGVLSYKNYEIRENPYDRWSNVGNLFDGDWGTYASDLSDIGADYKSEVAFFYKKPVNSNNYSFVTFKNAQGTYNLSLTESCWDFNETYIGFIVESEDDDRENEISCVTSYSSGLNRYFGTTLKLSNGGLFGYRVYETAMNWVFDLNDNNTGEIYVPSNTTNELIIIKNNYLDESLTHNFTDSNDLNASVWQSVITINVTESFSGNPISNWTLKNGSRVLINTTSSYDSFYGAVGDYDDLTLVSNSDEFNDRSLTSFSVSALDVKTFDYTILPTELNISATSVLSGSNIDNFTINFTSLNNSHSGSLSVTDGDSLFGVINGDTYNLTIDAPGYALYNYTTLLTISGNANYSFTLYTTNSINFSFRNEFDNALITANVTAKLISDSFSYNISTSNGTYYLDLLSPETYTIRYGADGGFDERFYYFDLANRTHNKLTLYLTNQSFTNVTATIYDQDNQLLEGAELRYLKYDSDSNSYLLVGMATTNFEGVTVIPLQLNTEYYKFQIYYGGELELTTIPAYIYSSTLTFRIVLTDPVGDDFFESVGVSGVVSYNNVTNNMKFDFSSDDGLSYAFCLYLYSVNAATGNTLLNSSCSTIASGTLLLPVTPVNGSTFLGKGVVTLDGGVIVLSEFYKTFFGDVGNKNLWLFGFLLLTGVFALSSVYSLRAAFVLTPLPLFLGSLIGVIPIGAGVTAGFVIVGIVLAVVVDK